MHSGARAQCTIQNNLGDDQNHTQTGDLKKKDTLEFTGGPVVRTLLSLPRAQILFLVRELKSHTFTYVSITLGLMGIIDGLLET